MENINGEIFTYGDSLQICNMIVLNLKDIDHDFTWHMRGISLMRIVIEILVYKRDINNQPFDYNIFKKNLEYDKLVKYLNENIQDKHKEELKIYFSLLPEQYEESHRYIIDRFRCISKIAMHPIKILSVDDLILNLI